MTQARNRPSDQKSLEAALARFSAEGFARREPALLQPAGIFLDRLGEDFRGRLYLASDGAGEFCLRPEYTIPVCLEYLASFEPGRPAALAYGGPIFRAGEGETLQAGLESFGRDDREAADAEILGVALDAAAAAGAPSLALQIGDAGLVKTFLDRLDLPAAWRRRFEIGHARGEPLAKMLSAPPRRENAVGAGVLAALEKANAGDARKLVEDLLAIAGISTVGGRSAGEIAERFLEQASLENDAGVGAEKRTLMETFFAITGSPDAASARLRALASEADLDLGFALDSFDTRSSFIAARGLELDRMRFAAGFARRLDYYSGFVFEARPAERPEAAPVVAGGRYDRLLRTLGAGQDVPAVGAAIWINRLSGEQE
ncbi:ATP phosphoribosyltransferase regulatory subunit [Methylocystis heyeri]|uniref:ATP phosphoribosyltransferase regulatory subunit n=1 Tax=Methylocystis heyeri TaxID=391905 RepID=A0A6B8KGD4_9HYPH|nr:ATP phosphoribosyltransferase regulatory subunit [Methylocystis heyeri]QGM47434.1 ATP phosphoribosyltransferase regulatory subunit [Methylocystis heyeri]